MPRYMSPEHAFFRLSFLCRPRTLWRERVRIRRDLRIAEWICRHYASRARA